MRQHISLFIVPGMPDNETAIETVTRLPDTDLEIIECPQSMKDLFECPFLKDEGDRSYYGLRGVEFFAKRFRQRTSSKVAEAV